MIHLLQLFSQNSRVTLHCSKQSVRYVSILSSVRENITAQRNSTRLGRGPSSGKGKTSSRGHKGQKARGKVKSWFEGGQTPIYKLFPKRGFVNNGRLDLEKLNLGKLQDWIDSGRLDPTAPITMRELYRSGVIGRVKDGVKLLADGKERFTHRVDISVTCASRAAIEAVEQLGGKYESRYFNQLGLRALVHPHLFERQPRFAMPTHHKQIEFYRNPENRGYLVNEKPFTLPDWPPYKRRLNAESESDKQKAAKAASAHHALQESAAEDANHHRWGFTENKILSVDTFLKA